jgi:hypothetical protein
MTRKHKSFHEQQRPTPAKKNILVFHSSDQSKLNKADF